MMENCVSQYLVESRIRLDDPCEAFSSGANKHNHPAAQRHLCYAGCRLSISASSTAGNGGLCVLIALIEANQI
jgi:hypothetical protein